MWSERITIIFYHNKKSPFQSEVLHVLRILKMSTSLNKSNRGTSIVCNLPVALAEKRVEVGGGVATRGLGGGAWGSAELSTSQVSVFVQWR